MSNTSIHFYNHDMKQSTFVYKIYNISLRCKCMLMIHSKYIIAHSVCMTHAKCPNQAPIWVLALTGPKITWVTTWLWRDTSISKRCCSMQSDPIISQSKIDNQYPLSMSLVPKSSTFPKSQLSNSCIYIWDDMIKAHQNIIIKCRWIFTWIREGYGQSCN